MPFGWHDYAMSEKQPSEGGQEQPPASGARSADWTPPPRDLRERAFMGGMLAGVALGIGLAVVVHVIRQASSGCQGYGCASVPIGGSEFLVLFLGLVIGLGLGIGLVAVVPQKTADSTSPRRATPADQPSAPSA